MLRSICPSLGTASDEELLHAVLSAWQSPVPHSRGGNQVADRIPLQHTTQHSWPILQATSQYITEGIF